MIGITKQQQTKKLAPLKEKPFKSKAYLEWFHNQNFGCFVCGDTNIELHHIDNGIGRRDDRTCVCLCQEHHRGKYSPHGFDSIFFYAAYPKEYLAEVAANLFKEWEDDRL